MFNIGPTEMILILIVALVVFGPGKLPEVGKAVGKTVREFKSAVNKIDEDIKKEVDDIKEAADLKDTLDIKLDNSSAAKPTVVETNKTEEALKEGVSLEK